MNISRLRHVLLSFVTGQGASQAIQIVSGFVLVRYMDMHEYGVVAFMLAVQGSAGILADLGLRDGIIAVLGSNVEDRKYLGGLVKAAMHQRLINLVPVSIGVCGAYLAFHFLQGLPLTTASFIAAASVVIVSFNGWTLYYSLPWILRHDMKNYYKPQWLFQFVRLLLILLCVTVGLLDVTTLAVANIVATCGTALWYRRRAVDWIVFPDRVNAKDVSDLRKFSYPLAPMTIFAAFQDQILIFILSVFGQTTNIAQVFALGRLAAVFQFFAAATTNLAAPWLARSPAEVLPKRFFAIIAMAAALSLVTFAGAVLAPSVYLWILGPNYKGLPTELALTIAAASFSFLASVLYYLNNSRNWVWPFSGISWVIIVIPLEIICVILFDLSQTTGALLLNLCIAFAAMSFHAAHTTLGFATRWKRK